MRQNKNTKRQGRRRPTGGDDGAAARLILDDTPPNPNRPAPSHLSLISSSQPSVRGVSPGRVRRRLMLADLVALMVGVAVTFLVQGALISTDPAVVRAEWLLLVASLPVWLLAGAANRLYVARANSRIWAEFTHIVKSTLIGTASIVGLAFLAQVDDLSRAWIVTLGIAVVCSLTIERGIARSVFRRLRRAGRLSRPVIVVGTGAEAAALVSMLVERPGLGYRPLGFVGSSDTTMRLTLPLLGPVDRVEDVAAMVGATGVMVSSGAVDTRSVNLLTRRLTHAGLHVTLATGLRDIDPSRVHVQDIGGQTLATVTPMVRHGWRHVAMRVFDHLVAITCLLLAAPLLIVAAIAIRLESRGPVFFRQRRVGLDGVPFDMFKLRTMCDGADAMKAELLELNESDGPLFKIRSDPRITRVGRFLRMSSLDEIPQFWNVLRGEMSVVGPRPALPAEVAQWDAEVHARLRVLPGITGMWQVSGRADTTYDEYKRLDLYYVDNWSLKHDVKIVLRTILVIVRGSGAR